MSPYYKPHINLAADTMTIKTTVKLAIILTIIPYMLCFAYIDRPVAFWLYQHGHWPIVIKICKMIAVIFASPNILILGFLLLIIGLILYQKSKNIAQAYPWLLIGSTSFFGILTTYVLKVILGRYRPIELLTNHLYGFHWFSFQYNLTSSPSGHATAGFALFFSLSIWLGKFNNIRILRWLCILAAIMIAVSRVILLKHFVSDVILGAGVGITSCLLVKQYLQNRLSIRQEN